MAVGKPDFELNSFGIQYKEKKVNYTNKRGGINISSTTQSEAEDSAEGCQGEGTASTCADLLSTVFHHGGVPRF